MMKKERSINELEKLLNEKVSIKPIAPGGWYVADEQSKVSARRYGDVALLQAYDSGDLVGYKVSAGKGYKWKPIVSVLMDLNPQFNICFRLVDRERRKLNDIIYDTGVQGADIRKHKKDGDKIECFKNKKCRAEVLKACKLEKKKAYDACIEKLEKKESAEVKIFAEFEASNADECYEDPKCKEAIEKTCKGEKRETSAVASAAGGGEVEPSATVSKAGKGEVYWCVDPEQPEKGAYEMGPDDEEFAARKCIGGDPKYASESEAKAAIRSFRASAADEPEAEAGGGGAGGQTEQPTGTEFKCREVTPLNLSTGNSKLNVSRGPRYRKWSGPLVKPTQKLTVNYLKERTGLIKALNLFKTAPLATGSGLDDRYGYRSHNAAVKIIDDILDIIGNIRKNCGNPAAPAESVLESRHHKLNQKLLKSFNLQKQTINESLKVDCAGCCIDKIERLARTLKPTFDDIQNKNPGPRSKGKSPRVYIKAARVQDFHNLLLLVDLTCLFKLLKKSTVPPAGEEGKPEPPKPPDEAPKPKPPQKAVARGVGACFDERYRSRTQIFMKPTEIFRGAGSSWEKLYKDLLRNGIFRVQNTDFSFGTGSVGYMPAQPGIFSYINIKKRESGNIQCLRVYLENLRGILASLIRSYQEERATEDVKAMYGGGSNSIARQAHRELSKAVNNITRLLKRAEELADAPKSAWPAVGSAGELETRRLVPPAAPAALPAGRGAVPKTEAELTQWFVDIVKRERKEKTCTEPAPVGVKGEYAARHVPCAFEKRLIAAALPGGHQSRVGVGSTATPLLVKIAAAIYGQKRAKDTAVLAMVHTAAMKAIEKLPVPPYPAVLKGERYTTKITSPAGSPSTKVTTIEPRSLRNANERRLEALNKALFKKLVK